MSQYLQDNQIQQAKADLEHVESSLDHLESCLHDVPDNCRNKFREAVREAIVIGVLLGDVKRSSPPPPMDEEGKIVLGKALKKHMEDLRDLHSKRLNVEQEVHNRLAA